MADLPPPPPPPPEDYDLDDMLPPPPPPPPVDYDDLPSPPQPPPPPPPRSEPSIIQVEPPPPPEPDYDLDDPPLRGGDDLTFPLPPALSQDSVGIDDFNQLNFCEDIPFQRKLFVHLFLNIYISMNSLYLWLQVRVHVMICMELMEL